MAFPTVADVNTLAQALLVDVAKEWATDAVLLPFVQTAYREAARHLRSKGMGLLRKESGSISVAVATVKLTRSVAPMYPSDLLRPIELEEGTVTTGPFTSMKLSEGFLPPDNTTQALKVWDWRGDEILFPNHATGAVFVRLQYEADLPALTGNASEIIIPDALDPVGFLTASYAALSHEEMTISEKWKEIALASLDEIAACEERVKEARGARWGTQ